MIALIRFLTLYVPLLLPLPAQAGDAAHVLTEDLDKIYTAIDHLERKEFLAAYDILIPLALQGDAEAQYQIGWMYDYGQGVAANDCIATLWADRAARQGHLMAQRSLAFSYMGGDGVQKNHKLAYRWFLHAVSHGLDWARKDERVFQLRLSPTEIDHIKSTMDNWRAEEQQPADVVVIPDQVMGQDLSRRSYYDLEYSSCVPDYKGTSVEKYGPPIYRPEN